MDTICPWTYIAKRRLDQALSQIQTLPEVKDSLALSPPIIRPYQLYPKFPSEPVNVFTWYRDNKFSGSEEKARMFTALMAEYGADVNIPFSALASGTGIMANTFHAHVVIQKVQEEKGSEMAGRVLDESYQAYFEEGKHPSSEDTLVNVCVQAGMTEEEARKTVHEKEEWAAETKGLIREQIGEGVDTVPTVRIEGRRRDLTLVGAKSVEEYVKAFVTIAKESR
jgi:predicted DsbA family dithiol-disulfide isomerase